MSWTQAQLGHKEGKTQFYLERKVIEISERKIMLALVLKE